jgi:ribonuclease P protein subunit RPR2
VRRGAEQSKKIAGERVERLLSLAEEVAKEDPKLSDRYVALAWRIKTKYNLRLPRSLKLRFCRRCLSYWKPGETSRVRIREGILTITCMRCGWIYRLPLPRKS